MIKKLKCLAQFDSNRDTNAIWQTADPIDFGWLVYGPSDLRERYRDSGQNLQRSKYLQIEMQLHLRDRIAAGEVKAFGVQIAPELKNEAQDIPQILFQSPDTRIDWDRCEILGLGRQFSDVRICLCERVNEPARQQIARTGPGKRGPKGYSEILDEAYSQLELEHDHFSDWALEKQMLEIQEKAAALHPGRFRGSKPGRSTVYRFLSKRRFKVPVP
jgi:hypothetical protein